MIPKTPIDYLCFFNPLGNVQLIYSMPVELMKNITPASSDPQG